MILWKIIEIKTKKKVIFNEEDGLEVIKNKDCNLKIEIDNSKKNVMDVIKTINPDDIVDINISTIPLENIITEIYKK